MSQIPPHRWKRRRDVSRQRRGCSGAGARNRGHGNPAARRGFAPPADGQRGHSPLDRQADRDGTPSPDPSGRVRGGARAAQRPWQMDGGRAGGWRRRPPQPPKRRGPLGPHGHPAGPADVLAPRRRRMPGILLHGGPIAAEDRASRDLIPTTSVARTLFDLAEAVDEPRLRRAFEEAARLRLLSLEELRRVHERNPGATSAWPDQPVDCGGGGRPGNEVRARGPLHRPLPRA